MCCDSHCLFFIKVRTGSLIFGYIAAALSAIGVLVCIGLGLVFVTSMVVYHDTLNYVVSLSLVEICFMELLAGFIFSVLLLCGISKNKPVLVKTYVIYGMIHLVLLTIVMIIIICVKLPVFGIPGLLGCVIYTLLIYMVYLTYKSMVTELQGRSVSNSPDQLMA